VDNFQVALLANVNELASRFGLKPYEFEASYQTFSRDAPVLHIAVRSKKEQQALKGLAEHLGMEWSGGETNQLSRMTNNSREYEGQYMLKGKDDKEIYDAVEKAITTAPAKKVTRR
jgi:hypothetical protein